MTISKLVSRYNHFILGDNKFAALRKRSFILISWVAILFALLGNVVNIVMGLPTELILITGFVNIMLIFIFIRIRTKPELNYERYVYLFWGLITITIPPLWIYNSGMDSNNIMLVFILFIGTILTIKRKHRITAFISIIILIILLLLLEYYFPHIIVRYSNKEQRLVDLLLGYPFYLALTYALINLMVRNNEYEQEKISLRNQQLDLLTKEKDLLNQKLALTITELEMMNHSKDKFISIIAHDLRSPFLGLMGLSRLLDTEIEMLTEYEKKTITQKLRKTIERLYDFLEELLLWGRIQQNALTITNEVININQEIDSILLVFEEILRNKKIDVEFTHSDQDKISTNRNLVATVLRNIISNAIKFSPHGSKIKIFSKVLEHKFQIHIQDYGLGISEPDLIDLFKVEKNISRRGTDGESGSGLGLIICWDIMKRLNGTIKVESKEGSGSTFIIEFPHES